MKRRRSKRTNPMVELIVAIRVAAVQIQIAPARNKARSDADAIPLTFVEKMPNTVKGNLAKTARTLMRSLPDLCTQDLPSVAMQLKEIAGVLGTKGGGELIAEDRLDGKSRRKKRL